MNTDNITVGAKTDLVRKIPGTLALYHNLATYTIENMDGIVTNLKEDKTHIIITMYGFIKRVEKEWLKWITYYNIEVPEEDGHLIFDIKFYKYKTFRESYYEPLLAISKKPIYKDILIIKMVIKTIVTIKTWSGSHY